MRLRDEADARGGCEEALASALSRSAEKMPSDVRAALRARLVESISPHREPLFARIIRPAIACAVGFTLIGGASYAAAAARPGDFLYTVKRKVAAAVGAPIPSDAEKGKTSNRGTVERTPASTAGQAGAKTSPKRGAGAGASTSRPATASAPARASVSSSHIPASARAKGRGGKPATAGPKRSHGKPRRKQGTSAKTQGARSSSATRSSAGAAHKR